MPQERKPFDWTRVADFTRAELIENVAPLIKRSRTVQERLWAKQRKEILLDLANLPADRCEYFRARFYEEYRFVTSILKNPAESEKNWGDGAVLELRVPYERDWGDEALLKLRDQLQAVWRGESWQTASDVLLYGVDKNTDIPTEWLHRLNHQESTWRLVRWAGGLFSFEPNSLILLPSVALGVGEWGSKMAVCANPDCPQKYFLKGRNTQQFCDRPPCAASGQRAHKLKWWNEHGKEWTRKRQSKIRDTKRR